MRLVAVPVASLIACGLVTACGGGGDGGTDAATFEGPPWVLTSLVDERSLELVTADGTRLVTYGPASP